MEIKILCQCGSKFKFDVEPVEGRSPGPVQCPSCGKDGTDATNAQIREKLAAAAPAPMTAATSPGTAGGPQVSIPAVRIPTPAVRVTAPAQAAAIPSPSPAPPPGPVVATAESATTTTSPTPGISPKMTVMPVPTEGAKALSVKAPGEATEHAGPPPSTAPSNASGSAGSPGSPKMAFMPAPAEGGKMLSVSGHSKAEEKPAEGGHGSPAAPPMPFPAANPASMRMSRSAPPPSSRGSFGLAVVGGIVGALIGAGLWYYLALNVIALRLFAWIPGLTAGLGAVLIGRKTSEKLAYTMGAIAAAVTLGMQFIIISAINEKRIEASVEAGYVERMALAKQAAEVRTDDQVRKLMVDDQDTDFEDEKTIEGTEVAKYRTSKLVPLQKFAKGEPSRTKFYETERTRVIEEELYRPYKVGIISMVIWIGSSISSAFQIARGRKT